MKKGLLILLALLLLAGCSKKETTPESNDKKGSVEASVDDKEAGEAKEGFVFVYEDVKVPLNVDAAPVLEALGKEDTYFEAASCAFQGLDKTYTYSGFEITTYPQGDKDFISTIYLIDDSVSTDKGIFIGSSLADVTAAYGDAYENKSGGYTYTLGDSTLAFVVEGDSVTSITYSAIVEGLN